MKIRKDSLTFQIWISFLSLAGILVLWLLLFLQTKNRSEQLALFSFDLAEVHNQFSENIVNYQDFLLSGYKKESFYKERQVNEFDSYQQNLRSVQVKLQKLKSRSEAQNLDISSTFNSILSKNVTLIKLTDSLETYMRIRGFKDYGLEGSMRESAHLLEKSKKINLGEILQLRRHEKDYLMRGEDIYKNAFHQLLDSLKSKYSDPGITALLTSYKRSFDEYLKLSDSLGSHQDSGMLHRIRIIHTEMNETFSELKAKNSERILALNSQQGQYLIFQTIFIALISILISLFLAKYLTHDIKLLNENFKKYIRSDFQNNPSKNSDKPKFKISSIEIRKLFANFQLLKETLNKTVLQLNKELEKSEQVANYKTRFLANMSHEIRTPLNGILGMLQLIKIEALTEEQRKNLILAEYSANHLLDVVNMILDYSKLEAGKIGIENRPIDLCRITKNLEGIFNSQAAEKNLDFKVNCGANVPTLMMGDSMRVQQVLMNLLSNALKFTNKGFVSLSVNRVVTDCNDLAILFEVIDTGEGIADSARQKLFKAFEQKDISTTRRHGGTGLGLTITNQLIELMGGELQLISEVGKGSKFYFQLSFERFYEAYELENSYSISDNDDIRFEEIKILVAEDNKVNQVVLGKMLERMNLTSKIVENGAEALRLWERENFDLILMDIHMPIMNGLEATRKIKAHPIYKLKKTPIIAITASAFLEDREEALECGMDDFITKPLIYKKLLSCIRSYYPRVSKVN